MKKFIKKYLLILLVSICFTGQGFAGFFDFLTPVSDPPKLSSLVTDFDYALFSQDYQIAKKEIATASEYFNTGYNNGDFAESQEEFDQFVQAFLMSVTHHNSAIESMNRAKGVIHEIVSENDEGYDSNTLTLIKDKVKTIDGIISTCEENIEIANTNMEKEYEDDLESDRGMDDESVEGGEETSASTEGVSSGETTSEEVSSESGSVGGGTMTAADIFGGSKTKLKDYATGTDGQGGGVRSLLENILDFLKKIFLALGVVMLTWGGFSLILTKGNEEEFKKRLKMVGGVATGFMLMAISATLVDYVFFGNGAIADNTTTFAKGGVTQIEGIVDFLTTFTVSIAVLFLVFSAFKLIFGGEDEENMTKTKKQVAMTMAGIAMMVSLEFIVKQVLTKGVTIGQVQMPDAAKGLELMAQWSNTLLGFVALLGVVSLIWAGAIAIANFGNDEQIEKAKKIVIAVVIGEIVAFSAWTIVRFFIL